MAVNPNEDTEFNDALRKYGIIPPKETTPPTPSPPSSPKLQDVLDDLTPEELRELGEEVTDDDLERSVDSYRRQRLAEDRLQQKRARFGRVYPIGRDDYTREVTEASKINEEGDEEEKGTGVICFLYKDGIPRSDRTSEHIQNLASRYPHSKFVSIVGNKCIADLPDSRIPMLIIYRKGEIRNQLIAWGADRERQLEELEALLILFGVLEPPLRGPLGEQRAHDGDDSEQEDDDPYSRMRSAATSTNARAPKNIRGQTKKDDSDSEFEFDM
ncbi:thioredoxin-like protein [Suillus paluster]|uniref:thioredoxin-like protein n=1 Tax=Suillus paluster TaxID=48578 RepID=UPI001B86A640|nr:thioredoxin-like protein [Suillus paluster]KAG1743189.1 thioredoxin-like protein [Suillus paluster]